MPKRRALLDEIHLSFFIPRRLTEAEGRAASRALKSRQFRRQLRDSLASLLQSNPELTRLHLVVSR